jgi:chromosome segregation ATPase
MTTELWATLIGGVVLLLTNLAGLVKVWTDLAKTKASRAETAERRDKEASDVRDSVQKLTWENARLKEDVQFLRTGMDDHQMQLSVLNTELAKLGTKLDNALELLHDLKEAK